MGCTKHSRTCWIDSRVNLYKEPFVYTSLYRVKICKSCNKILERKFTGITYRNIEGYLAKLFKVKKNEVIEPIDILNGEEPMTVDDKIVVRKRKR